MRMVFMPPPHATHAGAAAMPAWLCHDDSRQAHTARGGLPPLSRATSHVSGFDARLWPPASVQRRRRSTIVATLRIHYEGWVALPESFCRKLGLERGDDLEAELVEGTIVLRPSKGSAEAVQEGMAPEAAEAMPAPSILAAPAQDIEQPATVPDAPPSKRRGRPPKAKLA